MSFSLTQPLAAVTHSLVREAKSGCLRRKSLYQPTPGVLSLNGLGLSFNWRNSFTLTRTLSLRWGNSLLLLSTIHLDKVFSSSSVKTGGGPRCFLTEVCLIWNWIVARGILHFFAAAFLDRPFWTSLIASKSSDVYLLLFYVALCISW